MMEHNMKKKYISPQVEIAEWTIHDIITTSGIGYSVEISAMGDKNYTCSYDMSESRELQ